jgi:hypothetical protein
MSDKFPNSMPMDRIPVALAANHVAIQLVIAKLLENGALKAEDIQQMADKAPDSDVGSLVRLTFKPFIKEGGASG